MEDLITVEDKLALMIEINGRWFYKDPEVKTIDLMSAFYQNKLAGRQTLVVRLFATPADGENHDDGTADWNYNYRAEMKNPPVFRIRYEVPGKVG